MLKSPACNAGDAGSIPGHGTKIPHAKGQLSLYATTREKPTYHKEDPSNPKNCHSQKYK